MLSQTFRRGIRHASFTEQKQAQLEDELRGSRISKELVLIHQC